MFKRICASLAATVALLGVMYAAPEISENPGADAPGLSLSYTVRSTTGGFLFTNTVIDPWKMGDIAFAFDSSDTYTVRVDVVRTHYHNQYLGNVVTTNAFGDTVTNYYPTTTNILEFIWTNNLLNNAVTGHSVIYDSDDLPKDLYIMGYDVVHVTWTNTTPVGAWVTINGNK